MEERRRTIGYICPKCHKCVVADRSLFSLSAGQMKLPCPCGGSRLQVEYQEDGSYRFSVPCGACGGEHKATITGRQLMGHKILGFSCPETGIDCCYIGEESAVYTALPRLEQTIDKQEARKGQEGTFLDEAIMGEILGELRDIAARGGVSCSCGSKKWSVDIRYSSVELRCAQCGGTLRLPAATMDDLEDLCAKPKLMIHGRAAD